MIVRLFIKKNSEVIRLQTELTEVMELTEVTELTEVSELTEAPSIATTCYLNVVSAVWCDMSTKKIAELVTALFGIWH